MVTLLRWFTVVMLIALPASLALGEPSPGIELTPGENLIPLSLENSWNRTIAGLDVQVESSAIPAWLTFEGVERVIDLAPGEKVAQAFQLKFTVTNPPSNTETLIPLILADTQGNRWTVSLKASTLSGDAAPAYIDDLNMNYPNPFNPSTTITFSLREARHANLTIYNTLGQKVRTLVNDNLTAGSHSLKWDGCDDAGRSVSSGVYIYTLRAGTFVKTQRMMMME